MLQAVAPIVVQATAAPPLASLSHLGCQYCPICQFRWSVKKHHETEKSLWSWSMSCEKEIEQNGVKWESVASKHKYRRNVVVQGSGRSSIDNIKSALICEGLLDYKDVPLLGRLSSFVVPVQTMTT